MSLQEKLQPISEVVDQSMSQKVLMPRGEKMAWGQVILSKKNANRKGFGRIC